MASEFTHAMRSAELETAVPFLPAGGRILELGAGDGWQARQLAERGFSVVAVDVTPSRTVGTYFPVTTYDGRSLPFADHSFDAVYSSSVLEHVRDFEFVQAEVARVLTPSGIAVHCVPSSVWRFWTSIGHPAYVGRYAVRLMRSSRRRSYLQNEATRRAPVGSLVWIALVPPRHGEHGNAVTEQWLFSRRGWISRFRNSQWSVMKVVPTKLFYTGNELLGLRLGPQARRRLASVLGSSTLIYVLRPNGR